MRDKERIDKEREGNVTIKVTVRFNNNGANIVIVTVVVLLPEIKLYMNRFDNT